MIELRAYEAERRMPLHQFRVAVQMAGLIRDGYSVTRISKILVKSRGRLKYYIRQSPALQLILQMMNCKEDDEKTRTFKNYMADCIFEELHEILLQRHDIDRTISREQIARIHWRHGVVRDIR